MKFCESGSYTKFIEKRCKFFVRLLDRGINFEDFRGNFWKILKKFKKTFDKL